MRGTIVPTTDRPLVQSAYQNITFLFLNQNIYCGYLKEPSQWDGSFEHPKHMLKIMGKKIFTILRCNFCLSKPMCRYELYTYNDKKCILPVMAAVL